MHLGNRRAGIVVSAMLLGTTLSGCVVADRHPVVVGEVVAPRRAPPPPQVEVVPAPPRPRELVEWRPGHWQWERGNYVWLAGVWIDKRRPGDAWVPGHWEDRHDRWVWIEGRWR